MSDAVEVGKIGWIDMTVDDAPAGGSIAGLYQPKSD